MLRFFNRFLVLLVLVVITIAMTLSNSDQATIRIGPQFAVTTYAGVIYLSVFAVGCIAASLVGLFFGLKSYLRERRLLSAERTRQSFFSLFQKARNLMAAHEFNRARDIWEQVLRKEQDNIIARVELSRCLQELGEPREALRVLDATRASSRRSAEVLFRAAELNMELGNSTGASDNLAIIVSETPSKRALELARDVSERMTRIDDALEYQSELDKLGYNQDASVAVRTRLTYAQILRDSPDSTTLYETLQGFVRRHNTFVPALEKLAELELRLGRMDEGAELLVKAAKVSHGDPSKWAAVIDLWLGSSSGDSARRVDRALAAARASTQDARGAARVGAELLVARTLLTVNKVEEARRVLDGISSLAEREGVVVGGDLARDILTLRGICLARLGLAKDTAQIWQELLEPLGGTNGVALKNGAARGEFIQPPPTMSTP